MGEKIRNFINFAPPFYQTKDSANQSYNFKTYGYCFSPGKLTFFSENDKKQELKEFIYSEFENTGIFFSEKRNINQNQWIETYIIVSIYLLVYLAFYPFRTINLSILHLTSYLFINLLTCNYLLMQKAIIFIYLAEEDDVTVQLYEKPVPETDFVKHCAQRRKYPVLLKVSISSLVVVKLLYKALMYLSCFMCLNSSLKDILSISKLN